ncbi:hypothetical protein ACFQ48_04630 [Hymenobacter caeli]|uniref:Roadblock/LAMTOR2 domain-containing protein n=1 Tax=Hymenobacter caeli TaxID=2735894 RepID=A0ABX2FPZ1_9BACT|nr:hypothetical protein [Hymenobacter caeli]NRT19245.1 hypothetical protein [Hymenobacter caeli]
MFNPFRPKTVRPASSPAPAPEGWAPGEPPPAAVPHLPPPAALPPPPAAPPLPPPVPPALPVAAPAPPAASPGGALLLVASATTALEQLVAELPGLFFAGLTQVETGTAIQGRTPGDVLPAAPVARYHADVVRLERQALKAAQGAPPEVLREVLITMSDQLHLLRLVRNGELLLSIVLNPSLASLSLARIALQAAANTID